MWAWLGALGGGRTESADGAKLSVERGFKYAENEIAGGIVHGGLLSIWAQEQYAAYTSVCQLK
jgi:hypothetical protein